MVDRDAIRGYPSPPPKEEINNLIKDFFNNLKNSTEEFNNLKEEINKYSELNAQYNNLKKQLNDTQIKLSKSYSISGSIDRHKASIKKLETDMKNMMLRINDILNYSIKPYYIDFLCLNKDEIKRTTQDYSKNVNMGTLPITKDFYEMKVSDFADTIKNLIQIPAGGKSRKHKRKSRKYKRKSRRHRH